MTTGLDFVSNDAGDRVRSAHARDMGEDVIVALQRLVRLTRLHDVENEAFSRQLEQTHRLVVEYCLHAGTHLSVLFAGKVILIGGQILKGSRSAYEAAMDLGEILSWCGGAELAIARDITIKDLKAFADALSAAQRGQRSDTFESPTRKARLRAVKESARLRGVDIERLTVEQNIVRTYASAVVVMRRFFDDLRRGSYALPPKIKRIAQSLVDLSEGQTPAFLGVTEVRNQNHDDAGRSVNTAILAVATARQITNERAVLSQIAMAALMFDVARPRALKQFVTGLPGMVPRLSEDAEDELPSGAAAVLTALGRVNEPTVARTVVTYEALWLRRRDSLGSMYAGIREPTIQARIIAIARRYNDLVTPEPGLAPPLPDLAVSTVFRELDHPADRTILRMLVGALDIYPVGTLVKLSTGETAEVIAGRDVGAPTNRPRVRLIMDGRGGMIVPPRDVDLARPPANMGQVAIVRVLSTDGWEQGLESMGQEAQVGQAISSSPPPLAVSDSASVFPSRSATEPPSSVSESRSVEDSSFSELSAPSASRSLGWHDAPAPVAKSWRSPGRETVRAVPMARPTPIVADDERTIFEASPFVVEQAVDAAAAAADANAAAADANANADVAAGDDDDDDDDEAGTMFYQWSAGTSSVTGPRLREQAGIPPTAQGSFSKTPLVHVLVYVLDRELSGSLVVLDPEDREHCVFFDRGAPAKARTEHPVALLGEELISARVLPPAALDAMVRAAQEQSTLLGQYLTQNRLITKAALEEALVFQVIHRLEWMAKLPGQTRYEFYRDQNLLASWGGEMTPCNPLRAILSTMRSWNDHERIISNLMRLKDSPIELHPQSSLQGIALTAEEDAVLTSIRTHKLTLLELYDNTPSVDRGISALLYMLFATRQLRIPGQDRPPMRSSVKEPVVNSFTSDRISAAQRVDPAFQSHEGDDDELSYESYPSMASSVSAVAHAVIADMKEPSSYRGDTPFVSNQDALIPPGLQPTARGRLGSTPVIHVLTYMFDHQATGTVTFQESNGTCHLVYFENGSAAKVSTGRPIALLGELLVAAREISPHVLDDAVLTARGIEALLGEYLIVDGICSRKSVIQALEVQVTAKVVGLANLSDDGRYAYYRGVNLLTRWAGDDLFPTHPLSLILAVARECQDRRRIRGALHKLIDQQLRLHPQSDLSRLAATDAEVAVLNALVGTGRTLRELHSARIAGEEEVNSLVYALAITRQFLFRNQQKLPMRFFGARRSQLDPPLTPRASQAPTPDSHIPAEHTSSGMRVSFVPSPYPQSSYPMERAPRPQSKAVGPLPMPMPPPTRPSRSSRPGTGSNLPPVQLPPRPSQPPPPSSVAPAGRRSVIAPTMPSQEEKQRAAQDFQAAFEAMKHGDLARAERLARQAVEYDPDVPEHSALLAWVRGSGANPRAQNDGINALTNLLKKHPRCELALLFRAKLLRRTGKSEMALEDLEQLLKINPGHQEAQGEIRPLRAKHRRKA